VVVIPVVPVVPLAPGLDVPGCALCAPAVEPAVWGANTAAIITGDEVSRDEVGLADVHLSPTLRMWVTWKLLAVALADPLAGLAVLSLDVMGAG
jgi:hypothetical protein